MRRAAALRSSKRSGPTVSIGLAGAGSASAAPGNSSSEAALRPHGRPGELASGVQEAGALHRVGAFSDFSEGRPTDVGTHWAGPRAR